MNRSIKFRAWDKIQNKMFANVSTGTVTIWGDKGEASSSKDCIFMQYTGLKDKNGKEIYEGDIVVLWAVSKTIDQKPYKFGRFIPVEWKKDKWSIKSDLTYEVVGNMWENLALLPKDNA